MEKGHSLRPPCLCNKLNEIKLLVKLVKAGRPGRKTGRGVYEYRK